MKFCIPLVYIYNIPILREKHFLTEGPRLSWRGINKAQIGRECGMFIERTVTPIMNRATNIMGVTSRNYDNRKKPSLGLSGLFR